MPSSELYDTDIRFMEQLHVRPFKRIHRGLFGWGVESYAVKNMIDAGYLQLCYDWDRDAPMVTLTEAGQNRLLKEVQSNIQVL